MIPISQKEQEKKPNSQTNCIYKSLGTYIFFESKNKKEKEEENEQMAGVEGLK